MSEPINDIRDLEIGDGVKNRATGETYLIDKSWSGKAAVAVAVRCVAITDANIVEWEKIRRP